MNQLGLNFSGVAEISTREPLRIEVADHYPFAYRRAAFNALYDAGLDCFDVPPEERSTQETWEAATGFTGREGGLMWFGTPTERESQIILEACRAAEAAI